MIMFGCTQILSIILELLELYVCFQKVFEIKLRYCFNGSLKGRVFKVKRYFEGGLIKEVLIRLNLIRRLINFVYLNLVF